MGYEVHITRKADWFDEEGAVITLDEWLEYVASDPDMRADGYAEARMPNGTVLRTEDPGIAVWTAWSRHNEGGGMAWFCYREDHISFKSVDTEVLKKMYQIAETLGARVQGDDGETYDANGESNWEELKNPPAAERIRSIRWHRSGKSRGAGLWKARTSVMVVKAAKFVIFAVVAVLTGLLIIRFAQGL